MSKFKLLFVSIAVAAGYTLTTAYCGICGPVYTAFVQQFVPQTSLDSGG